MIDRNVRTHKISPGSAHWADFYSKWNSIAYGERLNSLAEYTLSYNMPLRVRVFREMQNPGVNAEVLLKGKEYQTLHLSDYKLYSYGQNYADDQFTEIVNEMKKAEIIIIGSPVYWHSMSGIIRNLIDRFYGPVSQGN